MFESFFPRPKLFLISLLSWAIIVVAFWYLAGDAVGKFFGFDLSSDDDKIVIGLNYFFTQNFLWFYIYYSIITLAFYFFWRLFEPHKWQLWSILGSSLIVFLVYINVQVSVVINNWFGPFYDMIQNALSETSTTTAQDLYLQLLTFALIAFPAIAVIIFNSFFVSHYIFRWRNAMNDRYVEKWGKIKDIEGASQRIQEDTMRFAAIMEGMGVRIIDAVMTLFAFLPLLLSLSIHVEELPIIGSIPYPLVTTVILWSIFGTLLLLIAGIRLPGLEFRNQRVEAAFRKELVLGEDNSENARPPTLRVLFSNVRRNYFRLYFNYLYFNFFRYMYLQADNIFAYFILIPTIAVGAITLGVMQQILRAFGQVANSFQFLVNSWTTIIELISIFKRLQAFEAQISGKDLPDIDLRYIANTNEDNT